MYVSQRDEALAYAKRRYAVKRVEISLRAKSYRDLSADKIREKNRDWREENKDYIREKKSEWAKNNPEKVRSIRSKRRALELMATPRWVNHADIERVYKDAVDLQRLHGEKYHVDHIVPLNGKTVCGLHVAWNLQVLTAEQNLKKGNRFNP